MEATATETAGLRCPPETPPLTSMPSRTPRPHLGPGDSQTFVALNVHCYPQLIVKKFPFVLNDRTDWAIDAVPNTTRTKVPGNDKDFLNCQNE